MCDVPLRFATERSLKSHEADRTGACPWERERIAHAVMCDQMTKIPIALVYNIFRKAGVRDPPITEVSWKGVAHRLNTAVGSRFFQTLSHVRASNPTSAQTRITAL